MANRHLLAVNKLEEFKNWLIDNDWKIVRTKGNYEVLRARKSTEKLPLIVYKKDKDGLVHLSVSDWNAKYIADFINSKKDNKSNNLQQQLDQQKAMWNELKEWAKDLLKGCDLILDRQQINNDLYNRSISQKRIIINMLSKMQELEQGGKNEN